MTMHTTVVDDDSCSQSLEDAALALEETDSGPVVDELLVDEQEPSSTAASRALTAVVRRLPSVKLLKTLVRSLVPPLLGIGAFILLWAALAPRVETSLGGLPGPREVATAGGGLVDEWQESRAARSAFYEAQDARNAALVAEGRADEVQEFKYSGTPTFVDQVQTSLRTVALGFLIATLVAVPLGLLSGLSRTFHAAINPLVQIMKPVSPLAWLPIVTMVISATMTSADPILPKSFVISALVVALCSVWPTLINTSVGTAAVPPDLVNVSRVLKLGWFTKLRKIVLPSALPYIFTGMRLSLGVGWMVLIAAEMLAQNPGLGKFVWDEFQNGSSESLARIMFAVVVIGTIGFVLDRLMSGAQRLAARGRTA
ncbi:MAG: ABC transporter permease [Actinomycetota bacterium]